MLRRNPKWKDRAAYLGGEAERAERPCDHPDCNEPGLYKAPKSRERLREYHWFCLDHVRAYNRTWNFFNGLTDDQVEASLRFDTIWNRPSWRFGTRPEHAEQILRDHIAREFGVGDDPGRRRTGQSSFQQNAGAPRPTSEEEHALSVLDLDYPIDFPTVKARYKELVKTHHPDRNGGSVKAEERLKAINRAYSTLKAALAPRSVSS